MFETFDGIPLHPLFVHAPIVLIPITAIAAIAWVLLPKHRARFRWWLVGLAVITWAMTLLAGSSGESLAETVRETALLEEHEELAEVLETFVWVLTIAILAAVGIDTWGDRLAGARKPLAILAAAAVVVGGIGAVTMDVLAGHAGAKSAWDGYESR